MSSPWNDGSVDCPMCGACRAFTIDPNSLDTGYCVAENKSWTVKAVIVECGICGRDTLKVLTVSSHNAAGKPIRKCKTCAGVAMVL